MRHIVTVGIGLLWIGAAACAAGSLVPFEQLRPLGELVRRAEDVTPERFARYRQVCVFFAVGFTAAGAAGFHWRAKVIAFVEGFRSNPIAEGRPRLRPREILLLVVVVAVGTLLRLQRLNDPVAYDEAYTYLNYARRPWYEAISDYNSTNNHLLNSLLMHVSTSIFGPREWALRIHVFLAGCVLPIAVFGWARTWRGAAGAGGDATAEADEAGRFRIGVPLPAAVLTAISPMLITYSTDARGYMLVALSAVAFDGFLSMARSAPGPRIWLGAWLALVGGLCSMPLMLYAAVPSLLWFVLLPGSTGEAAFTHSVVGRIRALIPLLGTSGLAVMLFYAPAYVFRGMLFLRDPIMQGTAAPHFALRLAECWRWAWEWWTEGAVPQWLWVLLIIPGSAAIGPRYRCWVRWSMPIAVILAANIVQRVTPPPRIYLHLAPWLFLVAACGIELTGRVLRLRRAGAAPWTSAIFALLILITGTVYAVPKRVLFHASERTSFVSVPDAIARIGRGGQRQSEAQYVLIAPLPCDLPSIFYLERAALRIPVNAHPKPGATVWLIARHGETPADVLRSDLVGMSAEVDAFGTWERVETFETLDLYRAASR